MTEYEQSVFISYAWGSERESVVNEIDESLQQRGIRIIRDKRALGYKGSIKEFMERIGRGSCIIVVISDKYLRSSNCMFELVEIAENKQFHDRVFPVVLNDANIYDPVKRIEYVKHWEAKRKELAKAMKGVDPANLHGIREEMDNYDRIRDRISGITSILKDMNTLTPDMHRDSEFSNLYDAIVERLNEGGTDVTAEFNEMTKKAESELRVKEVAAAKSRADTEQHAKEEEKRLSSQEAERPPLPNTRSELEEPKISSTPQTIVANPAPKKPISKGLILGIVTIIVLVIAGIGFALRPSPPYTSSSASCTVNNNESISIEVTNNSGKKLDAYWIDAGCAAEYYFTLDPGQTELLETYVGHVWHFVNPRNNTLYHQYSVQSGDTAISIP